MDDQGQGRWHFGRKARIGLITLTLMAGVMLMTGVVMERVARQDVMAYLTMFGKGPITLQFEGLRPSFTHVAWFTYSVSGDSQVSRAFWRLAPFRQVFLEK